MMATPAERIYEAAVERTVEQQGTLGRLTSAVSTLVAAALAALVLLKPAADGLENAEWPQIAGLIVAVAGVAMLLFWGRKVLSGVPIPGPQPRALFRAAKQADTLKKPDEFHIDAATSLEKAWISSHDQIQGLRRSFTMVVIGLSLELVGLLAADIVRPGASPPKPVPTAASLHLTRGYLNPRQVEISGELTDGAEGRVQITLTLLGRGGQAISLEPIIHRGRFAVHVAAPGYVAPLRSASYTITWAGSGSVAGASLAGELSRCPEDCQ
jgi:hypothetical protein